jgi:hypothetical protein
MIYGRQIKYNDSAQVLRLEMPSHWRAESITSCTIVINDTDGGALLASTAATVYTATTLNGAAAIGATTITLAATAGNLTAGDRIRLAGPYEDCEIAAYNSTSKVATLKRALTSAHATGVAVHGLWATYSLSTATVATWTKGLECVLTWSPNSDDVPLTETAIVEGYEFGAEAYRERFAALYPAEYEVAEYRLAHVYEEARQRLTHRLRGKNLDMDRVVNGELVMPVLLDFMRYLIVCSGGNAYASEREIAWSMFLASEEVLTSQPIWTDDDQDLAQGEEEVTVHEPWRRARGL